MTLTNNILSKGIGMNRQEHILNILNDKTISKQWLERYNDYPDEYDVKVLFNACCAHEIQYEHSEKMIDILPETRECIDYLGFNYIKTGCTTDFSKENMKVIQNKLELNDIYLDSYVSSECLNKPIQTTTPVTWPYNSATLTTETWKRQNRPSRPHPFMIQENMNLLGISNPKEVMKIDDTAIGIDEGKNAGCITVGVARWSIHMNIMNISDAYEFDETYPDIQDKLKHSRNVLREAGADYVIDTLDELPRVIESINYK